MLNKKIFGIFLIIILLLIPQTVFADSVYFETRIEEYTLTFNITEQGKLVINGTDGVSKSSVNIDIPDRTVNKMLSFFEKNIKEEDEVEYIKYPSLEKITDSPESYVLNICKNSSCKTYVSTEKPLLTIEEIENSELTQVIEKELMSFIKIAIGIAIAIVMLVFVIPFIIIFVFFIKAIKSKVKVTTTTTPQQEIGVSSKDEYIKRIQEISREQERKNSKKNNNDDPFSV